ncbi:apolipoprotein L2-like [Hyaena hyaena]|uniref:apolipoprotein L2-like n=1 Tax=Hyaena hyaena TaxID=95912 RepID=UPI0019231DDC|nr:apolipoprotein L2-like [Hyaena hyaena]
MALVCTHMKLSSAKMSLRLVTPERLGVLVLDQEEEAEVLYECLRKLEEGLYMEDMNRLWSDPLERERFLNEFLCLKEELEGQIRKLRELVDKADKVHRNCTVTNIVARSIGAMSSVMTVLGLGLAPVTAGISLPLWITGMALRAVSAVTRVSSNIVEHKKTSSLRAKASHLTSTGSDNREVVAKCLYENTPCSNSLKHWAKVLKNIGKNVHAIWLAKANRRLAAPAKRLMTTGRVSAWSGKKVQKAFRLVAVALATEGEWKGVALLLVMEVANLLKELKHLYEGATAKPAEELRQHAQLLESKLEELTQIHEHLIRS